MFKVQSLAEDFWKLWETVLGGRGWRSALALLELIEGDPFCSPAAWEQFYQRKALGVSPRKAYLDPKGM